MNEKPCTRDWKWKNRVQKKQAKTNSPVLQAETFMHSTMMTNEIKDFIEIERIQEELRAVLEDLKKTTQ